MSNITFSQFLHISSPTANVHTATLRRHGLISADELLALAQRRGAPLMPAPIATLQSAYSSISNATLAGALLDLQHPFDHRHLIAAGYLLSTMRIIDDGFDAIPFDAARFRYWWLLDAIVQAARCRYPRQKSWERMDEILEGSRLIHLTPEQVKQLPRPEEYVFRLLRQTKDGSE